MEILIRNNDVLSQKHGDNIILRLRNKEILTLNSTAKLIYELCENDSINGIYEKYKSYIIDFDDYDENLIRNDFIDVINLFKRKEIVEVKNE